MAAWTRLVWDQTLWMAANGPENCHIEQNPLNIHCPKGDKSFFVYQEIFQLYIECFHEQITYL